MRIRGIDRTKGALIISQLRMRGLTVFIGFIAVFFSLNQSFSVLTSNHQLYSSVSTDIVGGLHTVTESPLPADHAKLPIDLAVELTEEDEPEHDLDYANSSTIQQFAIEERLYTSFIKSRYLRLVSSLDSKTEVPYFILHHSWRNHIS